MENIKIRKWIFYFQSTKPHGSELKNLQSPIVPPTPLFSFSLLATCAEYSPLRHQPHPLHCNFSRQIRDKNCNTLCEFSDGNGVKWRDPWEFSLFLFVPFFFFLPYSSTLSKDTFVSFFFHFLIYIYFSQARVIYLNISIFLTNFIGQMDTKVYE